ncbi:MAG: tetratricopeptide repeat protein [Thermomicrobiales bacterium]
MSTEPSPAMPRPRASKLTTLPHEEWFVDAQLPTPLTALLGRADEVAVATALLGGDTRLLTLTGPGGVGKTRLAIQVAAELEPDVANGVAFVPLAALRDPDLVAATIARVLGVREGRDQPLIARLMAALRHKHALLVIDNVEQVIAAAPILAELLTACPHLRALVTSREPLRLSGERTLHVPPLARPAAIHLFAERAHAVDARFALTPANQPLVDAICARLDDLPLAIELAAARTKVLPLAALLSRLEQRLPLLTGGGRDQPTRLQTMHAAVAWSHDLLTDEERALFRRVAVFSGGFLLSAAEAVVSTQNPVPSAQPQAKTAPSQADSARLQQQPAPTDWALGIPLSDRDRLGHSLLDSLASLVDKSLVRQGDGEGDEPRFSLLETIREYALERLAASGEADEVRDRHAAWCLELAEHAVTFPMLETVHPEVFDRLEREYGNLGAALAWLDQRDETPTLLRLATALAPFWSLRSHRIEGLQWLERALAAERQAETSPALRARALHAAASLARTRGEPARALAFAESALALYRERDDDRDTAVGLNLLGALARGQGEYERAVALFDEALALFEQLNAPTWVALACCNLGILAYWQGYPEQAIALLEDTLHRYRELDDAWGVAITLSDLALITGDHGDHDRAARLLRECLAWQLRVGSIEGTVDSLARVACLLVARDQAADAASLLGAAEAAGQVLGYTFELPERERYDRAAEAAGARLGDAAFAAAWMAGRGISLADAVARVITLLEPASQAAPTPALPILDLVPPAGNAGLTPRERDVLLLLVEGRSDNEIAGALFISHRTASKHVAAILEKLGAVNRTAAATIAVRRGLI